MLRNSYIQILSEKVPHEVTEVILKSLFIEHVGIGSKEWENEDYSACTSKLSLMNNWN